MLGLYADSGGTPTTLLGTGRLANPVAGAWNKVAVDIPGIEAGQAYWIGLLNPADGYRHARWHDRAGGTGGAEQTGLDRSRVTLPQTWATDRCTRDGPVSGYVVGDAGRPAAAAGAQRHAGLAVLRRHGRRREPGGQDAQRREHRRRRRCRSPRPTTRAG